MEYNQDYIDELIARYLAGSATDADTAELMKWRIADPKNKKHFEQLRFLFDTAAQFFPKTEVDTDRAWNKVLSKIENKPSQSIIVESKPNIWGRALRIAAVIIFLLGLTEVLLFEFRDKAPEKLFSLSTEKEAVKQELPDGSEVMLSSNSKIVAIAGKRREYNLSGEGKFYVKHNEKEPFIIHADNLLIKDIGTVFHVKYIPGNDTTTVKVDTGSVNFYSNDNTGIILKAGEKGVFIKSLMRFTKIETNTNLNNEIQFENATLADVATKLNILFHVDIQFANEHLKSCRISFNFKATDHVDDVVEIIKQTFVLQSQREGDKITISGKGCE